MNFLLNIGLFHLVPLLIFLLLDYFYLGKIFLRNLLRFVKIFSNEFLLKSTLIPQLHLRRTIFKTLLIPIFLVFVILIITIGLNQSLFQDEYLSALEIPEKLRIEEEDGNVKLMNWKLVLKKYGRRYVGRKLTFMLPTVALRKETDFEHLYDSRREIYVERYYLRILGQRFDIVTPKVNMKLEDLKHCIIDEDEYYGIEYDDDDDDEEESDDDNVYYEGGDSDGDNYVFHLWVRRYESKIYFDCSKTSYFKGLLVFVMMLVLLIDVIVVLWIMAIMKMDYFDMMSYMMTKKLISVLLRVERVNDIDKFIRLTIQAAKYFRKEITKTFFKDEEKIVTQNWVISLKNEDRCFIGRKSQLRIEIFTLGLRMESVIIASIEDGYSNTKINLTSLDVCVDVCDASNEFLAAVGRNNSGFKKWAKDTRHDARRLRNMIDDIIRYHEVMKERRSVAVKKLVESCEDSEILKKECSICYEDNQRMMVLSCGHEICIECCMKLEKNECCFCKIPIELDEMELIMNE